MIFDASRAGIMCRNWNAAKQVYSLAQKNLQRSAEPSCLVLSCLAIILESCRQWIYPDVEIISPTPCYLELKTYNATTANTTQRTFYYSPSPHPKITRDALHFLLAYQLEKITRDGKTVFVPVHWKLITLENLLVDLKFEFNQSNRGLYGTDAAKALLSEGEVK